MSRTVSILVLCEDQQARLFIQAALEELDPRLLRRLRVIPYPGQVLRQGERGPKQAEGYTVYPAGSQHVRENYPRLVSERRRNEGRLREMGCRLIVHMDVDHSDGSPRTIADRMRELTSACVAQSIDPPSVTEPVAHLLPRRNIETWITFFLSESPVDERTAYPHMAKPADAEPAACKFAQFAKKNTQPAQAPPSLVHGLSEFRKAI